MPLGAPILCPETVSRSNGLLARVDRDLAERLHGVGVKRHALPAGLTRQSRDVLNRADLVVDPHHRADRYVVAYELAKRSRVHGPGRVHSEPALLGTFGRRLVHGAEHRLVLDAAM